MEKRSTKVFVSSSKSGGKVTSGLVNDCSCLQDHQHPQLCKSMNRLQICFLSYVFFPEVMCLSQVYYVWKAVWGLPITVRVISFHCILWSRYLTLFLIAEKGECWAQFYLIMFCFFFQLYNMTRFLCTSCLK